MRLKYKKKTHPKRKARLKNKVRIRKRISGYPERPRLSFFKSLNHIYAQVVNDFLGETLVSSSTLSLSQVKLKTSRKEEPQGKKSTPSKSEKSLGKEQKEESRSAKRGMSTIKMAEFVGKDIAKKSLSKKITSVVFDRSGYKYHGKVKAFVESARKGGLNF